MISCPDYNIIKAPLDSQVPLQEVLMLKFIFLFQIMTGMIHHRPWGESGKQYKGNNIM